MRDQWLSLSFAAMQENVTFTPMARELVSAEHGSGASSLDSLRVKFPSGTGYQQRTVTRIGNYQQTWQHNALPYGKVLRHECRYLTLPTHEA